MIDRALTGRGLDRIERSQRSLTHVVVEILVRQALVRIDHEITNTVRP